MTCGLATLLRQLRLLIRQEPPYPQYLLNMHTLVTSHMQDHTDNPPLHALRFSGALDKDPRTYNAPASAEVSCAVVGDGSLPDHFISIYERAGDTGAGATHSLSPLSEHVDPLTYPLLHVQGTLGYSTALQARSGAGISMSDFYCHRIMQRCSATTRYAELPHAGG